MKILILSLAAVMMLSACHDQTASQATSKPADTSKEVPTASEEGGISSGGGGTLPADPATVWQIERYIKTAKRDLRLYFRSEKYYAQQDGGKTDLDKKFFLEKYSVLEALEQTDLELLNDKPCYDGSGKEVDGSIHASRPNTICISSFRIAPKVPKQLARNEVLALIGHELSHLVGATETEAVEFQKSILFSLDYFKVDENRSEQFVENATKAVSKVTNSLEQVISQFSKLTDKELAGQMEKLNGEASDFYMKTMENPLSFYLKPEKDFLNIQSNRLMIGLWYSLSLAPDKIGTYWKKRLNEVYGQDLELTPDEFTRRQFSMTPADASAWPQETIKRIQSRDELLQLLTGLKEYYYDQSNFLWKFKFSAPLAKMVVGPWKSNAVNPWEKFVGEYSIVDRNCTAEGYHDNFMSDRTGFLIHHPETAPSLLMLREIFADGWGESGLEDNGSVVNAGATVSVSGDETSATRIAESGQTWAGSWNKQVETLKATSDGYLWKVRIDDKSEYTQKRSFVECTLKLQKK